MKQRVKKRIVMEPLDWFRGDGKNHSQAKTLLFRFDVGQP